MTGTKIRNEDFERLCKRYEAGENAVELAREYGVDPSGLRRRFARAGVHVRSRKEDAQLRSTTHSPETKQKAFELFGQGLTMREIASETGISHGRLSIILRDEFGVEFRSSTKRHKLSADQKADLASLYQNGWEYRGLANKFGIAPTTVGEVLKSEGIQPRVGWAKYRTIQWTDRKGHKHTFKSTWELAYAEYLDKQDLDWEYEAVSFPLKVHKRYTPDFSIWEAGEIRCLVEIHGWCDEPTRRRIEEFVGLYPALMLELLGPKEMVELGLISRSYLHHPQAEEMSRFRFAQKTL